ncbi:tetratricopeptide repeat protein [Brachyspira innocens]|uniref:tetratricopeptide repeat protein n=1 Tax=Brachyspira innocens TaxID=13264 RepID=UPI000370E81E|nr:hypothetical protein [Brachyspira innocens]
MEQEHNFIKNDENYEYANEKPASNGVMLTIILFIAVIIAGICLWIYNSNNVSQNNAYSNINTNFYTNTVISNKNDILNRNNIKKNLDYLMDIKYDEYIAPHINSFNEFFNNNQFINSLDTRTVVIVFISALATIIVGALLFRGSSDNKEEDDDINIKDSINDNNDEKNNKNKEIYSEGISNNNDNKIIDTNYDGDKLVLKNDYYKYNKKGDNVFWNVVKKNKNTEENLNINELSLMAIKEVENGNDDSAISIYTRMLNSNDNNTAVLKNRALLFSKKYQETSDDKYFNAALKDYNRIIDINNFNEESNIDVLKDRSVLYTKKYHYTADENYFTLALNDYNRAVEDNNNTDDLSTLLIYSDLYNEKYKNTSDKKYFNMSLDNYNKALNIDKNNTSIYINRGWLYLIDYKINNDIKSLDNAQKDIEYGLNIEKNNFYLLNNKGIVSLYRYQVEKQVKDLKESEYNFLQSIKNNKSKSVLAESYYYLSLVYDEYSKLTTITAEKMKEYTEKSNHYLEESKKLGYKILNTEAAK